MTISFLASGRFGEANWSAGGAYEPGLRGNIPSRTSQRPGKRKIRGIKSNREAQGKLLRLAIPARGCADHGTTLTAAFVG